MIESDHVFPLLLSACPSFARDYASSVENCGVELAYSHAAAFSRHLLALRNGGDIEALEAAGAAIERLLSEGSEEVRELTIAGLLEGIQNGWSNKGTDPECFVRYLGPFGVRSWADLNAGWGGPAQAVPQGKRRESGGCVD